MITEMDELKCQNSFDGIDASALDPRLKADLKETIEEAKLNLNGRTLEERCASIARNQFDTSRLLADIIIQFKDVMDELRKPRQPKRTWKDVIAEGRWPLCILGSVIAVCAIFQPQIVSLLKALVKLI